MKSALKIWIVGCVFAPAFVFAQPADPGEGLHPRDRGKAEVMERMKKARDARQSSESATTPATRLEHRRERLRQVGRQKSNNAYDAEFRTHFRRLARIMRISEIAAETENAGLAKRAKSLLERELARHARAMKRQVQEAQDAAKPTASQPDSGTAP